MADEVEEWDEHAKQEAKRVRRATARRFNGDAPPMIVAACADQKWWPTRVQWSQWNSLLLVEKYGVSDEGFWYGHCPLHDNERLPDRPTAMFNFHLACLWCLSDPKCTAPKRAMALNNVTLLLTKRALEDVAKVT